MYSTKHGKNVVYFLDFPNWVGGSNKVLLTQAYIMSQRGYNVTIVIPNDEKEEHDSEYDRICDEYELNKVTMKYSVATCMEEIDIVSVLKHYMEVFCFLKEMETDLVHSTQINIAAELAARKLHIPHLMNIYQTDLEMFDINWIDIYPHYHSADSELFSDRWKNGLGISSKCIRVAYKKKKIQENDRYGCKTLRLLSIAVFAEHKNQLEILKFILLCKKNGIQVTLTFLGNNRTPYGEKCLEYVRSNDLEKEVKFEGFTSDIEIFFSRSDLMILASKVESYPGVIVESMANKVPVLSTPVAGVPEIIEDGRNGFLTEGFCYLDIYNAFNKYLIFKDNNRIQKIKQCAYETFLKYHSYEKAGEQLSQYYEWIFSDYKKEIKNIQINDIRRMFEKYVKGEFFKKLSPHTKKHIWFLFHLRKKIKYHNLQRVIIWGAGTFGEIALEWSEILDCKDKVIGFIDTYKKGNYMGYPIFDVNECHVRTCDLIFLAIGDPDNCLKSMDFLELCGKKRNEDYFLILNGSIRI